MLVDQDDRPHTDTPQRGHEAAGARYACNEVEDAPEHDVLTALYSLSKEISGRQRLVIAIDDLQWVDVASLHCLDHLMARLENVSISVIATYTPGSPGADTPLLADFTSLFAQRLVLQDLAEPSATTMLAELLGGRPDTDFVKACLDATRCNPLFLHALLREIRRRRTPLDASGVAEIGPAELAETLFTRYFGHSADTVTALETIALLAESADPDLVAELTGSTRAQLDAAVRQPIDLGLLRAEPELYTFVHPVLRSAVLNRLPPATRQRLHLESAKILHETGASKERVARELLQADRSQQHSWIPDVLYRSAEDAVANNREDDARRYLHAALDSSGDDFRGKVLRRLGQLEVYRHPSVAADHFRLSLEFPWPDETLAAINTERAHALFLSDGAAAAAEALSSGLETITGSDDRAGIRSDLQIFKVMAGTSSPHDDDSESGGRNVMLFALRELWSGKSRPRALKYAQQAVKTSSTLNGHPLRHVIPLVTLVYGDEFAAARAECDQLMAMSREQDSASLHTTALMLQGLINYRIGDLIEGYNDSISVLGSLPGEAAQGHGHGTTRRFAVSKAVAASLDSGSYNEASRLLDRYWLSADSAEGLDSALLFFERGRLRVAKGELQDGLRDLEECGKNTTAFGQENPAVCPWRSEAALVHIALGNPEQAIRLAEVELDRARVWGAPRTLGIALRAAGLAHRDQRGLALLAESHEVLSGSNALLERARTHTHLGIGLRKRNRLVEARKHLREARILAEKCGARPLSQTAAQELIAAGARPRRVAQIGPEALTPSERRVAMLAAEGRTNREIAEQLHVLRRTVEIHLSRTYHKLGISGRGRLAAAISVPGAKGQAVGSSS
jgi:DNA-binding CsgD family transcriptional regulator